VKILLSVVLFVAGFCAPSHAADKPNILWLIAEDFGNHLSCCGTKEVWTPNLDKLAADGMRYTHCYTTAPVCSSSRSAFNTGMYQTTIGAHNHRAHRDDGFKLPEGVRILPHWMKDAGYFTANIIEFPEGTGFKGVGKNDWNFSYEGKAYDSSKWSDLKAHQPFYAQINFQETHRTFHAPAKADPAKVEIPPYYPDHPVTRKDWAQYLDAATEVDRKIGVVLKLLEADGLAGNTIIFFFGDNGQAHVRGKQFCYESGMNVPLIIYIPKDVAAPKNFKAGTVSEQLIDAIDFAPTIMGFAGAKKPEKMEGRAFLGENAEAPREYSFGARDRCDETVFRFRTVRDARYRYIRNFTPNRPFLSPNDYKEKSYPVWNLLKELHAAGKLTPEQDFLCQPKMPEEELYDEVSDPFEIKNLAKMPEHAETLKRLKGVLEKWIADTHDQGAVMEPDDLVKNKGVKPGGNPHNGYVESTLPEKKSFYEKKNN
jgi:N-sulfoglucosamine sulfohydrolase